MEVSGFVLGLWIATGKCQVDPEKGRVDPENVRFRGV
jgi:hypothetical protein